MTGLPTNPKYLLGQMDQELRRLRRFVETAHPLAMQVALKDLVLGSIDDVRKVRDELVESMKQYEQAMLVQDLKAANTWAAQQRDCERVGKQKA